MELAREAGVSPDILRKWMLMIERAEMTAADVEEPLVPASRVRELEREVEELRRLLGRQAVTLQVLEKEGLL